MAGFAIWGFYLLIGLGVAMQMFERGEKGLLSISCGLIWPMLLGMAIGEIASTAIRKNHRRAGKPHPTDRAVRTAGELVD